MDKVGNGNRLALHTSQPTCEAMPCPDDHQQLLASIPMSSDPDSTQSLELSVKSARDAKSLLLSNWHGATTHALHLFPSRQEPLPESYSQVEHHQVKLTTLPGPPRSPPPLPYIQIHDTHVTHSHFQGILPLLRSASMSASAPASPPHAGQNPWSSLFPISSCCIPTRDTENTLHRQSRPKPRAQACVVPRS